ncbi:MAG: DUF91 domain-containing protein, partial [Burkholderiaceae bacterium]|nr:DUF91 domain-containing protein [Burkholderiaceae bacterium]
MKTIKLWAVRKGESANLSVGPVASIENTETEELLEQLLVQEPELLMEGLTLVGRQLPTAGGPLDLLGIDEEGRLVVFELKRGILTREAIAQVLDYASDLAEMDIEQLAGIIEDTSGKAGIDKIEDFQELYNEQFPSSTSPLAESPRMVLVGLGADDRARRMVNFLAAAGVDIQLLTFHAFASEQSLLLARQAERVPLRPTTPPATYTKEGNLRVLQEKAKRLNVEQLMNGVADSIREHLPGAYQWPGKTAFTYSLAEITESGTRSLRAYVTLSLVDGHPGKLVLYIQKRAVEAAGEGIQAFCQRYAN